jgi:anti-anti-sigma factor
MALAIAARKLGDVTILDLQGEAVAGPGSELLSNSLQELAAQGARKIVLNLAAVEKIDTTGISAIVRGFVTLERLGGKLILLNVRGRVRLVLEMTRLLNVFPNFDNEGVALNSLR